MTSSPDRTSAAGSIGLVTATGATTRPTASLILASTSPGPAVCSSTSSTPHSAVIAAQAPSLITTSSGMPRSAARAGRAAP